MATFLDKLFGDPNKKYIKKLDPIVEIINSLESEVQKLSDGELRAKTSEFKQRLESEKLDDILPEAFAVVREAAKRVLGQRHYDVQLKGGIALHRGSIAEMRTGEGKTLVATLPSYLNALIGKGVHIVTVNDYLARRDAVWMGRVHYFLGLTVSCIMHDVAYMYDPDYKDEEIVKIAQDGSDVMGVVDPKDVETASFKVEHEFLRPISRKEAYEADVLYGTNNEFGFDYLRDNMAASLKDKVQRKHHFAIIDEVDSILIDEARTPLIISAPAEESADLYYKFANLVKSFKENEDYNIDEKMKASTLTESGITRLEKALNVENLYDDGGISLVHHAEQALRAHAIYHKDKDYVVKDGEIIIVDEFTGRLMPGRRWSEGLHQAVEAKEGVKIERESQTLATITFQNFFRLYEKLSGMTGTAATEEEEFQKIYGLDVVVVPTNKPTVRKDLADRVYRTEMGKYKAVVKEAKERHEKGQPVLIGTISIEKNEVVSQLLEQAGVPHKLLNAKNHEQEGETIAQAGRKGAVTVATNMAGRGVDVILGGNPVNPQEMEEVKNLGGLCVLGTERHESRRIDNQLRGRSGRQGDFGESQFYVSLEDDLMRIFAGDRVKSLMERFKIPEDVPIESSIVSKSIESAQSKVEQHNFDIRKHLLEYDDVLNRHRETVYNKRNKILSEEENLKGDVLETIEREIEQVVLFHTPETGDREEWNVEEILEVARTIFAVPSDMRDRLEKIRFGNGSKLEDTEARTAIVEALVIEAKKSYEETENRLIEESSDSSIMRKTEKGLWLRGIDTLWIEHLDTIGHLRQGIGLRAYGQRDPLVEYKKEAYRMFQELQHLIDKQVVYSIYKVGVTHQPARSLLDRQGMNMSGAVKNMGKVIEGEVIKDRKSAEKVGRNDQCPCGSGKKYKKCHGE